MSGSQVPGPLCGFSDPPIDSGTSALTWSPVPGPVCRSRDPGASLLPRWRAQSVEGGFSPKLLSMSPDAIALLKSIEQLRLTPYDDQTGRDTTKWVKGATIGYGHLIAQADWDTYKNGLTQAEADALFAADMAPFEEAVRQAILVGLQQYEFDALVIFAFNLGIPQFKGSSVVKLINDPKAQTGYASLEAAWKAWNKSQGQVMKGLNNRRNCEWDIYTRAVYQRW